MTLHRFRRLSLHVHSVRDLHNLVWAHGGRGGTLLDTRVRAVVVTCGGSGMCGTPKLLPDFRMDLQELDIIIEDNVAVGIAVELCKDVVGGLGDAAGGERLIHGGKLLFVDVAIIIGVKHLELLEEECELEQILLNYSEGMHGVRSRLAQRNGTGDCGEIISCAASHIFLEVEAFPFALTLVPDEEIVVANPVMRLKNRIRWGMAPTDLRVRCPAASLTCRYRSCRVSR